MKPRILLLIVPLTAIISFAVLTPVLVHAGAYVPDSSLQAPAPTSGGWFGTAWRVFSDPVGAATSVAGKGISLVFDAALSIVVTAIGGGLLILAGFIFDWLATYSLLGTLYQSGQGTIVYEGWTIFRDLANILFIFILIYIGIATILRLASAQTYKLLARVIVIALLINFSLVITRVVIDASNILALAFYDAFPPSNSVAGFVSGPFSGLGATKSLSAPFVESSGLLRFFESSLFDGWLAERTDVLGVGSASGEVFAYNIGELVVLLVAAFVLFAAGILFAIRTVLLLILMILSPVAFAMYILPQTEGYARRWWSTLLNQAFFAPIFLALYYVVARMFGVLFQSTSISNNATNFYGSIGTIIINFAVVTIFLVSTLIISKQLGAYGAGTLMSRGKKWGRQGAGFAARHTVGRAADRLLGSETADRIRKSDSFLGRNLVLRPLQSVSGAKFEGTKSYTTVKEERGKEIDDNLRRYRHDPGSLSKYITNLSGDDQIHAFEKLSAKDRAAVEIDGQLNPTVAASLRGRLTPEEREKTEDAAKDLRKGNKNRLTRRAIEAYATGQAPPAGAPPSLAAAVAALPPNETRKLPPNLRTDPAVIRELSASQLADLTRGGDLTQPQVQAILAVVTGPAYSKQKEHLRYVQSPPVRHVWNP